jgi:NAD(P)-dependent dehydrogenase (short-subunit alcohol dehydrogenase family)
LSNNPEHTENRRTDLNHPTLLITGCSTGIGHVTAHHLNKQGYHVIATARRQCDVDMLSNEGLTAMQLDMSDADSIQACSTRVLELTGGCLYGLFHNAGFGQPGAIEDVPLPALREQFETNFFGVHELTRRLLPTMIQQGGGRILLNSSVLGFVAMPYRGAYIASKFALEGWADTLRLELKGTGVFVSLIQPGPINSRFRANALKAFERNIDAGHSRHADQYLQQQQRLEAMNSSAAFVLPPQAVARVVARSLQARRPRAHYGVTLPTHLFRGLKRGLPTAWLDGILGKSG